MADEERASDNEQSGDYSQDRDEHTRTVTDLIDEIRRDAFTRSMSKRFATWRPTPQPE